MRGQLVMSDYVEDKVCGHEEWLYSPDLGARFSPTWIGEECIKDADLRGADFEGAILDGVDLVRVCLRDVSFAGAWLENVRFVDCDLRGVLFARTEKFDVAFEGCLLEGADFGDHPMGGRIT